jgi:hypothetical protein
MGAAASLGSKAADASDITDLDGAKAEIVALRKAITENMPKQLDRNNMVKQSYRAGKASLSNRELTPEMHEKFCNVIGPRGYTFDMAIQCGIDGRSGTGMAIPDEESYYLWQEWYDLLIDKQVPQPPPGQAPSHRSIYKLQQATSYKRSSTSPYTRMWPVFFFFFPFDTLQTH